MALEFLWTSHALKRLSERGLTRRAAEQAVRDLHPLRVPNDGAADWRIDANRISVLYDHPVANKTNVVRIITAWPKRRERRRHLKPIGTDEGELS
jgi:hypothetical protein